MGDDLRRDLASALAGWRSRDDLAALRWSEPDAWHLTLAFLGDVTPDRVGTLAEELARVATRHDAFDLPAGGLGGFPAAGRARVAWYGIGDPDGRLRRLADDVGRAVDLVPDRPFAAHVTLARARGRSIDLRDWVREGDEPTGSLAVDRVELMRSHLGRGPSHYETLASVPLRRLRNE
jgi:2'-5' RNA ligase